MYLAVFLKVPHGLGTMATTKTSTLTLYCLERMLLLVSSGWFTFPLVGSQFAFLSCPQVARRTSSSNTSASSFLYSMWLSLQVGWNWLTQGPTHTTQLIIFGLWLTWPNTIRKPIDPTSTRCLLPVAFLLQNKLMHLLSHHMDHQKKSEVFSK